MRRPKNQEHRASGSSPQWRALRTTAEGGREEMCSGAELKSSVNGVASGFVNASNKERKRLNND